MSEAGTRLFTVRGLVSHRLRASHILSEAGATARGPASGHSRPYRADGTDGVASPTSSRRPRPPHTCLPVRGGRVRGSAHRGHDPALRTGLLRGAVSMQPLRRHHGAHGPARSRRAPPVVSGAGARAKRGWRPPGVRVPLRPGRRSVAVASCPPAPRRHRECRQRPCRRAGGTWAPTAEGIHLWSGRPVRGTGAPGRLPSTAARGQRAATGTELSASGRVEGLRHGSGTSDPVPL